MPWFSISYPGPSDLSPFHILPTCAFIFFISRLPQSHSYSQLSALLPITAIAEWKKYQVSVHIFLPYWVNSPVLHKMNDLSNLTMAVVKQ